MYISSETPTMDIFDEYVLTNYCDKIVKPNKVLYLDKNRNVIGFKGQYNYWKLYKYDKYGNKIFTQDYDGNWEKRKYQAGKIIQFSNSLGTHWSKTK